MTTSDRCRFARLVERRDRTMGSAPCKESPQENGFCQAHNYCHDIIMRADAINFPRTEINEVFTVAGRAGWFWLACHLSPPGEVFRALRQSPGVDHYDQVIKALEKAEKAFDEAARQRYARLSEQANR